MDNIVKKVEERASNKNDLGLKGGLMGVVLFFFYYYRVTKTKRYEDLSLDLLKQILSKMLVNLRSLKIFSFNDPVFNLTGMVEISNTFLLLIEKKFVAMDFYDFFDDVDTLVLKYLSETYVIDFSNETGVIGLCRYALQRPIKTELIELALNHLIKGFEKKLYNIDPVFLFPSEILQDVKLFLLEADKMNEVFEQIRELRQKIKDFEENRSILQSNCSEYTILQQLREAEIGYDRKKIKCLLANLIEESQNVVIQGLASMSLQKTSLPHWWKLF